MSGVTLTGGEGFWLAVRALAGLDRDQAKAATWLRPEPAFRLNPSALHLETLYVNSPLADSPVLADAHPLV